MTGWGFSLGRPWLRYPLAGLAAVVLLAACSSGRHYPSPESRAQARQKALPAWQADEASCIAAVSTGAAPDSGNTLFVHPGMISMLLNWGEGIAVEGSGFLVREGYASRTVTLNSRDPERIAGLIADDPGNRFIGIHYSMGGRADLIARSVKATQEAAQTTGRAVSYFPVVIDPTSFGQIGDVLDMDSPYLGQMFVILSSERSALRTAIRQVSPHVLDHPKTHLLYAEDFGLDWGHFTVLNSLSAEEPDINQLRTRELIGLIAGGINTGEPAWRMEVKLNELKARYAQADERPVMEDWTRQGEPALACNAWQKAQR